MPDLPQGVVTFLFTDVEGSTRRWQDAPDVMAQALHLHDEEFPDGVFFIDLAPIDSHRDIAQTAAESLGIALTGNDDLETQLLAHLVNERQLLIFDNFEHVIEGASLLAR